MPRKAPRRLDSDHLWEYAVRALAGRAHSIGELREKLRGRAARSEDVDATIVRLKEYGYLDDRRFAESFAQARLENQRFGRRRVLSDLQARRVAPALARQTVEQLYGSRDEERLVEDHLRRRYRFRSREHLFEGEKDLAAAYRRLLRAGFGSGAVLRVLKRFAANPELLDGFEPPEETTYE